MIIAAVIPILYKSAKLTMGLRGYDYYLDQPTRYPHTMISLEILMMTSLEMMIMNSMFMKRRQATPESER